MCSKKKTARERPISSKEIKHVFAELRDPQRALILCRQTEKIKKSGQEICDFTLLYSKILRWCNRPQSALSIIEKTLAGPGQAAFKTWCLLEKGLVLSDLRKAFSAIVIFEEALEKASKQKDGNLEAEIHLALGQAKSNAGMQAPALASLDRALETAQACGTGSITSSIYAHRALCEFRLGNLEGSRIEAERGIPYENEDPLGVAECYRGIAIIHSVSGSSALAIENYRKSLKIFRDLYYVPGLVRGYLSLGASYLRLGEVEMAEHFFRKAVVLTEEGENLPLIGVVYSRLGTMYLAQGNYDEALKCFEKDKELSRDIENPSNIAHIYRNIGNCLSLTGSYAKAMDALKNAADQFAGVDDRMNQVLTELDLILAGILAAGAPGGPEKELRERLQRLSHAPARPGEEHPLRKGRMLFVEACLAASSGHWDQAEELMTQATALIEQHLMYSEEAEMVFLFGKLAVRREQTGRGIKWLRQALKVAETYSLGAMVRTIIDILDKLGEDILVDYSFEKEAAKVGKKEIVIEAGGLASATENIIGSSDAIMAVLAESREAADTDATILCIGQTGTGKELLARAIHRWSRRAGKKFIAVNCGAIPKELVESALFGHVKGAFSGAVMDQVGSIEAANGGTILLDEITELPFASQVKVLRFLEYKEIQPLGVAEARKVDVRVIASTNRDPMKSVKEGCLREDLYYRLSVIPIYIPPLVERDDDVVEIARHFIATLPLSKKKGVFGLTPAAEAWLKKQSWPGNVRELNNVMLRAVVFAKGGKISVENLESGRRTSIDAAAQFEKLDDLIRRHIMDALKRCDGNQIKAARLLGIHRNTLRNKLARISIEEL
jgi:DNA-binding NtrC family response regulator/tetratricopeptide (TPR) repeat protein